MEELLSGRSEWPGLESSGIQPIGKFGIGFFSVFLLGQKVRVISRRYDKGAADTRVLEFDSIEDRPIVREAKTSELPADFCTRVSVRLDDSPIEIEMMDPDLPAAYVRDIERKKVLPKAALERLIPRILRLVAAVDVEIEIISPGKHIVHAANWLSVDPDRFLGEVLSGMQDEAIAFWRTGHSGLLAVLRDEKGQIFGRAALSMYGSDDRSYVSTGGLSVGGFFSSSSRSNWFVGILRGETQDAARNLTQMDVPANVLAKWATSQAEIIEQSRYSLKSLVQGANRVLELDGDPKDLPYCFAGGKFISFGEFQTIVSRKRRIHLILTEGYRSQLELRDMSNLGPTTLSTPMKENVCSLVWQDRSPTLFEEEFSKNLVISGGGAVAQGDFGRAADVISNAAQITSRIWKKPTSFSIEPMQIYDVNYFRAPVLNWVLTLAPNE